MARPDVLAQPAPHDARECFVGEFGKLVGGTPKRFVPMLIGLELAKQQGTESVLQVHWRLAQRALASLSGGFDSGRDVM